MLDVVAPDKLHQSYQVWGATTASLNALDAGTP
jgi:hypothetical protein